MSKYAYTDDMGEISGFGGSYEEACRDMVVAGLEHLDARPESRPDFHGFLSSQNNEDAQALDKAVTEVCPDATGAMFGAAMNHILYIHKNGWEKYVQEMRRRR